MKPRIAQIAESFDEQDADLGGRDPLDFEGYTGQLARAREESGHVEACVWGWAIVGGVQCALVAMDFGFLGGSMGVAVGEKVARAFDAARARKLAVVTVTASGGARMQEGIVALVQMAKTAEARRQHAAAGLAQVTVLRSPTTGGVYASFASLADVTIASPDATIAFAGPRVVEQLTGARPNPHMQSAEFALEHGLIDAIVPPANQAGIVASVLRALDPSVEGKSVRGRVRGHVDEPSDDRAASPERTAWERLQLARHPQRPRAPQILDALLATSFELRGDRSGAPDDATVIASVGMTRVFPQPVGPNRWAGGARQVMAIAQDSSGGRRIRPEGFRKAIRAIEMAGRLRLPVVTLIDTHGADPVPSSEGHGLASAIARTFLALLDCPSPTVAIVVGEGGSGGALAMAVCDRVIAWENAIFSVIAPDGAASILYRDASRGPELAERLRITAHDLVRLEIADDVFAEPEDGAHTDPAAAAESLSGRIAAELATLAGIGKRKRLRERQRRWREAGNRWIEHIRP